MKKLADFIIFEKYLSKPLILKNGKIANISGLLILQKGKTSKICGPLILH
jgi:hypothetical protein